MSLNSLKIGDIPPTLPKPKSENDIIASWKGDKSKILVSIICHTYNHIDYLSDALNSFLMQKTDFPFEIILHDDASTDGTTNIVREYAEKYPNIILPIIQPENQWSKGIMPSNFTFNKARGKYIAFCEGDDYWTDENKISIQADFLKKNPHISVCGHNAIITQENKVTNLSKLPISFQKSLSAHALQRGSFILTLTVMFVNEIKDQPEERKYFINGDNFLFSRLGRFGGYKYMEDISPGVYRAHEGGIWSSLSHKQKIANQINTSYWMARYYSRIGDSDLASHFDSHALKIIVNNMDSFSFKDIVKLNKLIIKEVLKERLPLLMNLRRRLYR